MNNRAYWNLELSKRMLAYLLTIALGILFIVPLLWMFATSLKTNPEVLRSSVSLIPKSMEWKNYKDAVTRIPFFDFFSNTMQLSIGIVIGKVVSCVLVAYSLAKIPWKGRNIVFLLTLSTMMLPAQVTMIPVYVLFSKFGWLNTFKPLIVPAFFGDAFFIYLLRQFMLRLPRDLAEAAEIDGCTEWGIFSRIYIPLILPALATVALFSFINTYNDFSGPLIYITDSAKWPLAMGIREFINIRGTAYGTLMAACTLYTIPLIILFMLTQKTFVRGIATTGIK